MNDERAPASMLWNVLLLGLVLVATTLPAQGQSFSSPTNISANAGASDD